MEDSNITIFRNTVIEEDSGDQVTRVEVCEEGDLEILLVREVKQVGQMAEVGMKSIFTYSTGVMHLIQLTRKLCKSDPF